MLNDLYRELILERYKHPRFRGRVKQPDFAYEDENPLCGDHVRIELKVDGEGRVQEARFDGQGCAISMAAADLLMEYVQGRSLEELKAMEKETMFDEVLGFKPKTAARVKCALLSYKVLKAAIYGLEGGAAGDET